MMNKFAYRKYMINTVLLTTDEKYYFHEFPATLSR